MTPAIAGSRAGRGDRGRRHRHLGRLSPRQHGLEGRGAAGARPAHLRHDLACGRPDGHVRLDVRDLDRDAQVHARSLRRLEAETGQATGFKPVGFIEVAADADRLEEYRRVAAFNRFCGVDVQEISPAEVKRLFPLARVDDILAGFYVKDDGRANPVDVTMALAKAARMAGARIIEGVPVDAGAAAQGAASPACARRTATSQAEVRRQLHRHVGAPARRAGRRHDPEPGGRALLPDHREDRGPAAEPAGARRPGVLRLLPRGSRRPAGRPVRAGLRAVECRGHSRRTSRSARSRPTGSA